MSNNNWEGGTLIIPKDQYVGLRKAVITEWNEWRLDLLVRAKAYREELRSAGKGLRGVKKAEAVIERLRSLCGYPRWNEQARLDFYLLEGLLFDRAGTVNRALKSRAPTRSQMGILPVSAGNTLSYGEAQIVLIDSERQVKYYSGENNHAVEEARELRMTKFLLSQLKRVSWKRGTGGVFVGNDEYNRELEYAGAGGNYVTQRFGPLGKPDPSLLGRRRF